MVSRARLDLSLPETWLLGRLYGHTRSTAADLAQEFAVAPERLATIARRLEQRGLIHDGADVIDLTPEGREVLERLVDAGRAELTALCSHWERHDGDDLRPVLRRLAASLVADIPESET